MAHHGPFVFPYMLWTLWGPNCEGTLASHIAKGTMDEEARTGAQNHSHGKPMKPQLDKMHSNKLFQTVQI